MKNLRQVISLGALALALIHIIWPDLAIDAVALALIVIAIIPWLAPIVKSLELPGGWKVEFQELQKAASQAESAGLLAPADATPKDEQITPNPQADPNLALAGLRIELEKRFVALASQHGISTTGKGIAMLMVALTKAGVITPEEQVAFAELLVPLNSAVHGALVDSRASEWAMTVGSRLLASLDQRIERGA